MNIRRDTHREDHMMENKRNGMEWSPNIVNWMPIKIQSFEKIGENEPKKGFLLFWSITEFRKKDKNMIQFWLIFSKDLEMKLKVSSYFVDLCDSTVCYQLKSRYFFKWTACGQPFGEVGNKQANKLAQFLLKYHQFWQIWNSISDKKWFH